jgi:omega-hydroxy-beta-dihydromenaquinone-9 sulfotransferase
MTAPKRSLEKRTSLRPSPRQGNKYPFYAYRIWQGMPTAVGYRILMHNRFAVSPSRILFALRLALYAPFNSALTALQNIIYGNEIDHAVIERSPLFVIGHWRTGTTLMHQLISLGEDFTAPTVLECFAPSHFLISGPLLRLLSFVLPSKRPMDDVALNWDGPQEDEFALLNLGVKSPYETLIFPNNRPIYEEFLSLRGLSDQQLATWKRGMTTFLHTVNLRSKRDQIRSSLPRRIVLKSPTHTARLRVLREMFPAAQYIHMVRHPYELFSSTLLLWSALYDTQGLQKPQFEALPNGAPSIEDYVFDMMDALYRDFFEQVDHIAPRQYYEVRYEDLIRAPLVEMERIYCQLELGDFTAFRPKLECHLSKLALFQPNKHDLLERHKAAIRRRWGWYMERYGYPA